MFVIVICCLLMCACAKTSTVSIISQPSLLGPLPMVPLNMGQGDAPLSPPPGSQLERPIMRCGASDSYSYIRNGFICADGSQPFKSAPTGAARNSRQGSYSSKDYPHIVDMYKVTCPDGIRSVYVDMYGCRNALRRQIEEDYGSKGQLLEHRQLRVQYMKLFGEGSYAKALPLIEQAAEEYKKANRARSPEYAQVLTEMAAVHRHLGNSDVARELLENATALWRKLGWPDDYHMPETLYFLGTLHNENQDYQKAAESYEQSAALFEKTTGAYEPRLALALKELATAYLALRRPVQALNTLRKVLRIYEWIYGSNHLQVSSALIGMAHIYESEGRMELATPLRRRSQQIMKLWYSRVPSSE